MKNTRRTFFGITFVVLERKKTEDEERRLLFEKIEAYKQSDDQPESCLAKPLEADPVLLSAVNKVDVRDLIKERML